MNKNQRFSELLKKGMEAEAFSVRGLETAIRDKYGKTSKVSRSLLSMYLLEKIPPSYESGDQIASVLGLDRSVMLDAVYKARVQSHKAKEDLRYETFKREKGLP